MLRAAMLEAFWRIAGRLPSLPVWKLTHRVADALYLFQPVWGGGASSWEFLGYRLRSPIGIAAGFDKNGSLAWVSDALGMGFHVVGSVLPEPWPGVKPKILVRVNGRATLNRLGLPSMGARAVAYRLARLRAIVGSKLRIAVSIAAFTVKGYVEAYRLLVPYADWFEVNISCPNVEEHRSFEDPDQALEVCKALKPHVKPVLIKIPPTLDKDKLQQYIDVVLECGAAGLVAANTLRVNLDGVDAGLGGPPLYPIVLRMISYARSIAPGRLALVAVGGIDSAEKIAVALRLGANLVEIYSGVLLRGPLAIAHAARSLLASKNPPSIGAYTAERAFRAAWAPSPTIASTESY